MKQLTVEERRLLVVSNELLKGESNLKQKYGFDWDYSCLNHCAIGLTGTIFGGECCLCSQAAKYLGLNHVNAALVFLNGAQFPEHASGKAHIVGANLFKAYETGVAAANWTNLQRFIYDYGDPNPGEILEQHNVHDPSTLRVGFINEMMRLIRSA